MGCLMSVFVFVVCACARGAGVLFWRKLADWAEKETQ